MASISHLLAASSLCFTIAQGAISLTPAASANGASQVLNPSFAGLGIEPSNLFSFTGGSEPNQMSINLLQHLANYSGAPPHLRIGGNTGDYMIYNASYTAFNIGSNKYSISTATSPADASIFGPGYLEALDRFPTGTPITFGLNLAYDESDYIDRICTAAAAVVDNLNNTVLYSFELGNEPDLYTEGWNGQRTGSYGGQQYTTEWLDRAGAVYRNVLQSRGINSSFFEAAQTASTIGTTFTIDDLVDDGITAEVNGSQYLSAWNQHDYFYFIGVSTYGLTLNYLTNFDNTDSQFKYWATEIAGALQTGYPYNLREMADVGPTGIANISNAFGSALWTLNFYCYAATLNVSSVEMHMTDNSYSAAWQPIQNLGEAPNVRPSYYAMAAMAQLIGAGNGTTRIAALDTTNSYDRAYAAYTDDKLASLVLINGNQANASDSNKASTNFTISLPDFGGKTLYLSYLSADGADSTSNVTWNGLSFEQDSLATQTTVSDDSGQTVNIAKDGSATIMVRDSQAVIAHIGSRLGSQNATDTVAASSSGSSGSSGSSSSTKKGGAQSSKTSSSSAVSTKSSGGGKSASVASASIAAVTAAPSSSSPSTKTSKSPDLLTGDKGLMFVLVFGSVILGLMF